MDKTVKPQKKLDDKVGGLAARNNEAKQNAVPLDSRSLSMSVCDYPKTIQSKTMNDYSFFMA